MTTSMYDQVLKMIKRLNLPEQVPLLATLSRMVRDHVTEAKLHSIMELGRSSLDGRPQNV